jgi:hypothetical protein
LGSFVSQLLLLPVALLLRERGGVLPVVAVLIPMWIKRVLGNDLEVHRGVPMARYVERLVYDRDRATAG